MSHTILIWGAVLSALVFLFIRSRSWFCVRPLIKAMMAILLALGMVHAPTPALWLMAIGFGLSALGDYFLDIDNDKWFLPGLISFFTAHIAFLIYLFGHMTALSEFSALDWSLSVGLLGLCIGFYLWLYPSLPTDMKIPVAAYSLVISMMGITALVSTLPSMLVPFGAILFIASDIVLATERFKFKFVWDKHINWALYASGQILLAIGVLGGA